MITHDPEAALTGADEALLWPDGIEPADRQGYEQARALWRTYTSEPDASPAVLANAARFFQITDKPRAQALLLRGHRHYPGERWSQRFGDSYGIVLVGKAWRFGGVRTWVSVAEPASRYTASVRRKLLRSADDVLLPVTAEHVMRSPHPIPILG